MRESSKQPQLEGQYGSARARLRGALASARYGQPPITLTEALRPFLSRFAFAALYFLTLFLVGSLGYTLIEGWPWPDSLYMSVTTVSSVGYMEVRPLSSAGRTFTMVLIFLGVSGLGIWWAHRSYR